MGQSQMKNLRDIARALVADGKGLLTMDESNATCNKRFAAAGIPQTEEARRACWQDRQNFGCHGTYFLVCPCYLAPGFGHLARPGFKRPRGAASFVA
jgi:hypothetical protein